jgi:hypothetical protein
MFTRIIGLISITIFFVSVVNAQIPRTLSYQGVLTDSSANPKPDGVYTFTFRLYDTSSGGNAIWTEIKDVNVERGLFSTILGDKVSFEPNIKFDKQYWLGIKPGAEQELPQRVPLSSVGYSLNSLKADNALYADSARSTGTIPDNIITGSKIADGTITFIKIGQNGATTNQVIKWNGTAWIAANEGTGAGIYLPLTGGMMTGPITSTYNPPITMGKGNFGTNNINTGVDAFVAGRNNRARGDYSVVAGGGSHDLFDSNATLGAYSTVSGGRRNTAIATETTIGGGYKNIASGNNAIVGGGYVNTASGTNAIVVGGRFNVASGNYAAIGGGTEDTASGVYATVGGGYANITSGDNATIGGGAYNKANGNYAIAAGGGGNLAIGNYSSVGGGNSNKAVGIASTVSGGSVNRSYGNYSVVSGGGGWYTSDSNSAIGNFSVIPGGRSNRATGQHSLAAGRRAKADHDGAFVWADTTNADFISTAVNQFNLRASGGVRIYTNPGLTSGVTLSAGSSTWSVVSDSLLKRNIRIVDGDEILEKLLRLPIKQWSYLSQDASIEHIGPMAQDFYSLFGLGESDKTISTIDPAGVALAAIQALCKENQELKMRLTDLEKRLQLLEENNLKDYSFDGTH